MSSSATNSVRELASLPSAPDSPVLSRAEVNEIFETWTNTAKSSSGDSGIGQPTYSVVNQKVAVAAGSITGRSQRKQLQVRTNTKYQI